MCVRPELYCHKLDIHFMMYYTDIHQGLLCLDQSKGRNVNS